MFNVNTLHTHSIIMYMYHVISHDPPSIVPGEVDSPGHRFQNVSWEELQVSKETDTHTMLHDQVSKGKELGLGLVTIELYNFLALLLEPILYSLNNKDTGTLLQWLINKDTAAETYSLHYTICTVCPRIIPRLHPQGRLLLAVRKNGSDRNLSR